MVAAVSVGILLVAGDTMTSTEQQLENEQVEGGFVELSQQMRTASTNNDISRSMDLAVGQNGAVVTTDSGNFQIEGGDVDTNISIGAIEYEGDDGTRIAYQAGGVFRETGQETRIVSAPPISYDPERESLTFPIVNVRNETQLSSGDVYVDHHETNSLQNATLIENDSVTITVTSKYYRGWEQYFEQQGGPTAVQNVETFPNNETGIVTAEFGYREISDAFTTGALYAIDYESGGNPGTDDIVEKAAFPSLTEEVERVINETESPNSEYQDEPIVRLGSVDSTEPLDEGVYFADEVTESGHLDVDLSDGNATVVVNGSIYADGETITVNDYEDGNQLSVYMSGDYNAKNGGNTCVDTTGSDCYTNNDGTVIQLVTEEDSKIDFGPGGESRFEGVLYAGGYKANWEKRHGCEKQVCIHSNPNIYGSIVSSSVDIQGGSGIDFEYDEDLKDADMSIYPDPSILPPQLTYLNVAEHKVDVKNN